MRLWSIHPKLLDAKGLVALWREALLAQKVLQNGTKGYKHHPQLARFRACSNPTGAIAAYLREVHRESVRRGYRFDRTKIGRPIYGSRLRVTRGQAAYELKHLTRKLKARDRVAYVKLRAHKKLLPHPIFRLVAGRIESWERQLP
jgi:hypothetical protein